MQAHQRYESMSDDSKEQAITYQIRIEGQLGQQWTDWFDGLSITPGEGGTTLLTGPVVDQSALYGLLKKVRDLGIPLVSVNRIERHEPLDPSQITKGDNE
jgi:hypothetical protein